MPSLFGWYDTCRQNKQITLRKIFHFYLHLNKHIEHFTRYFLFSPFIYISLTHTWEKMLPRNFMFAFICRTKWEHSQHSHIYRGTLTIKLPCGFPCKLIYTRCISVQLETNAASYTVYVPFLFTSNIYTCIQIHRHSTIDGYKFTVKFNHRCILTHSDLQTKMHKESHGYIHREIQRFIQIHSEIQTYAYRFYHFFQNQQEKILPAYKLSFSKHAQYDSLKNMYTIFTCQFSVFKNRLVVLTPLPDSVPY